MVELRVPDRELLSNVNDVTVEDLPRFARVRRERDPPEIEDVPVATREALRSIPLGDLPDGAEVAVTAGSRGIHDMPAVLETVIKALRERGLEPFVMAAMGSHGGATSEGQVETLASLGVTEESVGAEIRSSMAVERVATDAEGRPVFAAEDALGADAILLCNRVKPHTDYAGSIESGLSKMAVVGLGKHRGAEAMHNAALARGFDEVIPERAGVLFEETPVVGGVAVIENANERAAEVVGLPVGEILEREPELLDRARELFPELPADHLDLLVLDEMGKDVSGTGLDTNVVGRVWFHGQDEPEAPEITRIYVRSLTEASHGNALGMGLADFVHEDVLAAADLGTTYVNVATSGEPSRARIPLAVPDDESALLLAFSTTGARDPGDMRIARIRNTLDPDDLLVSEPVAEDLADHPDVTVGELEPLAIEDGRLGEAF